jgi:hypothetical protein
MRHSEADFYYWNITSHSGFYDRVRLGNYFTHLVEIVALPLLFLMNSGSL